MIDEDMLVEILNRIDDYMDKLVAQQKFKDWTEMQSFLNARYESRLANILQAKSSSIDILKPEMKSKIGIRKQRLFDHLKQSFQKKRAQ